MEIMEVKFEKSSKILVKFRTTLKKDKEIVPTVLSSIASTGIGSTVPAEDIQKDFKFRTNAAYMFTYDKKTRELLVVPDEKSEPKNFTVRMFPEDQRRIQEKANEYGFKSIGEYLRFTGIHAKEPEIIIDRQAED